MPEFFNLISAKQPDPRSSAFQLNRLQMLQIQRIIADLYSSSSAQISRIRVHQRSN